MKSAQLNMLYSHLDFDNGAEKYGGGKVRRPLCPPLGPPYSLPITPVSGFCLPHWKALKTVICHPLYVCRYRPVTPPTPHFFSLIIYTYKEIYKHIYNMYKYIHYYINYRNI